MKLKPSSFQESNNQNLLAIGIVALFLIYARIEYLIR